MDVYVQIHRPAEALNDRDRTAAAVHDPSQVSHVAQETEHGPNGNTHDGATQVVIPRQPVAQPRRQRQHPLSHRHRREHVVHQVRGAFRHPAPGAARAGRPPFARKRDEPIQPTVITAKTRKAARQAPASQHLAKLLLDDPGQPFPVAQTGGLRAEALEVMADHLVHDALRRHPRLIGRRGLGHASV